MMLGNTLWQRRLVLDRLRREAALPHVRDPVAGNTRIMDSPFSQPWLDEISYTQQINYPWETQL